MRGGHFCTYATAPSASHAKKPSVGGRVNKPPADQKHGAGPATLDARLSRLENLLEMALAASNPGVKRAMSAIAATPNTEPARPGTVSSESASVGWEDTSATAAASKVQQDTLPPEDSGGMLFLGNGQSQFVTSMHWALLAEEVSLIVDQPDNWSS